MGGTVAASALGAEALFQNPAALGRVEPGSPAEAAFGYDMLIESAYQGSGAYAKPLGPGTLGAGFVYSAQSAQTAYTPVGDASGSFRPYDVAAGLGYAGRAGPLLFGGGLKAVRSSIDDQSGTTAAVDAGVVAPHVSDLGEGTIDVGAAVSNLGPPLKLGASSDPLPLRARAGAQWRVNPTFDAGLDVVFPVDQSAYVTLGTEARFPAALVGSKRPWVAALRGGYDLSRGRDVDGFAGLSFGGGLDLASLRLDYAWIALGALGSANRVTLAFRF